MDYIVNLQMPGKSGGLELGVRISPESLVREDELNSVILDGQMAKTLFAFAKSLDKTLVTCLDTPGFICSRLLWSYLMEPMRPVERGHGTIQDVDTTRKLGAGYPIGPFELCDFIGLDTVKFILDALASDRPKDSVHACPKILEQLIADGKFGRKTGEGFYKYDKQGKIIS